MARDTGDTTEQRDKTTTNSPSPLTPDAAIILGIASTALPFARTPEAEVERWLRVLRLHGHVGIAMQALGVGEVPLPQRHATSDRDLEAGASGGDRDSLARVTDEAVRIAGQRGERVLTSTDILVAVMGVYGEDFDRVLRAHGNDRDELLERLGIGMA